MEEKKSVVLEIHDSSLELNSPSVGAVEENTVKTEEDDENG